MTHLEIDLELFKAKFIREGHNRFIAYVEFEGEVIECYVPSSSKLANFINLKNKEVIISKNQVARRTKYTLFAVSYYNKYIMLNLNLVNKLLLSYVTVNNTFKNFYLEKKINDYKSDILLIDDIGETTIIEAKGIIGVKREVIFPINQSDRAIEQLKQIKSFLLQGMKIDYYLVSLSPIIKSIKLDNSNVGYQQLLLECVELGMNLNAITLEYLITDNIVQAKKLKLKLV